MFTGTCVFSYHYKATVECGTAWPVRTVVGLVKYHGHLMPNCLCPVLGCDLLSVKYVGSRKCFGWYCSGV